MAFATDRPVVEAQAIVEIDSQLMGVNESCVYIPTWKTQFRPWLGPQFVFLLTHPQRYVVSGHAGKYKVRKTAAYAAACDDDLEISSPPDHIQNLRKQMSCRYWQQGRCTRGDACRYFYNKSSACPLPIIQVELALPRPFAFSRKLQKKTCPFESLMHATRRWVITTS